jgi:hypothetical protein
VNQVGTGAMLCFKARKAEDMEGAQQSREPGTERGSLGQSGGSLGQSGGAWDRAGEPGTEQGAWDRSI